MAIVAKDNDIQIECLGLGAWGTNAYIIVCLQTGNSVLVDAPAEAETILEKLQGTSCKYILLTHNHMDHVGALSELRSRLRVLLAAHLLDGGNLSPPPEVLLKDGDTVSVGDLKLEVLHTPGHTRGSLCFRVGRYLISGDTLFPGGPGKTGSPADLKQVIRSITEKLFSLPDDTLVYPGHGEPAMLRKEKDAFAVFSSRPHDPDLCGDVLWLSS